MLCEYESKKLVEFVLPLSRGEPIVLAGVGAHVFTDGTVTTRPTYTFRY